MTHAPLHRLARMVPRDPREPHRVASPLELFFDLVFVIAVSLASQHLHHLESEGHLGTGVLGYLMVFFAIWWAWMNFTWFASAFDTDDWLYRVMTVVQMAGVLVLAAGAGDAMEHQDFTLATLGYVIMRLALVAQWLRAAASHPALRATALRYAGGIAVVQLLWVARLLLPESVGLVSFAVLALIEISIPVWAESRGATPWHPEHIAERYGCFTLILLGESLLASANAVLAAIDEGHHIPDLLTISGAGLVIAAGMWWVYFAREQHRHLSGFRTALIYGYGHYLIFAAAGAFSAGIEVAIDLVAGHTETPPLAAAATITIPVALVILGIWALTLRRDLTRVASVVLVLGAAIVLAATFVPGVGTVLVVAVGTIVAVVATELLPARSGETTAPAQ